ncbi:UTP--glucose-1-phosphate uridylyltransferase [Paractinoplanes brasiliensis]|uniref:UTP--glucose-1-phosphate uridylyltransferase n=1 Tax=Paractinoplanes brasiliensis TaxID=52695 RepID=A0A4R6J9G8_9ACTN|nr:UTP--glucose-1-phosphate uridylyltransferase [Actinoplanes brasiliensis]TDO32280.1 UTP--glucose-1-phosphate uridylyltransferase [Actinoplanes brasiliensis]GID27852.1 UTP--glucose-1-phosphate uridylyltransferase [Actinoplanes brasiliensis]
METPAFVVAALAKAQRDGAHSADLAALRRRLQQFRVSGAGLLPGELLEPLRDVVALTDLQNPGAGRAREILDRLVVVKLNGGLGTSMGLTGPKSLLEVKGRLTFLDTIATQILAARSRYGIRLPLLLKNSASASREALAVLDRYPGLGQQYLPLEFLQGRDPKLRADNLYPVEWPGNPDLEWFSPGHGDLYTTLARSGTLDRLIDAGLRWCFVSNSDNLGATVDARLAAWVADAQIPFLMEVVRGTPADRKGGHLALYRDGTVLRETAQVPAGDHSFTDIERWRFYNTNNLWIDLEALRRLQEADPTGPALPLIVNRKTVDPRDPSSPPIIQLETAAGAAIASIPGALPVLVPRTRFAPVKTTDDLLVVRSDAYEVTGDGQVRPTFDGPGPVVTLDPRHFGMIADFEQRFPAGPPSLRHATRLRVDGKVTFGAGVVVHGNVRIVGPCQVRDGTLLRE